MLPDLNLMENKICDEGVAVLVAALQKNTSLRYLDLRENNDISMEGQLMALKLVIDISSVEATLQSNHTLRGIYVNYTSGPTRSLDVDPKELVQQLAYLATDIHKENDYDPVAVGREKLIRMQLHSGIRARLAKLQGVSQSVYSEITFILLPEALSLVSCRHGYGELYSALRSTIAEVISVVNRRRCIKQQLAYHTTELEEVTLELAEIKAEKREAQGVKVSEYQSKPRP